VIEKNGSGTGEKSKGMKKLLVAKKKGIMKDVLKL